jgi:hypothetical protein
MEEKMKAQNQFTHILIAVIVFLSAVLSLPAQETLPPPPPAAIGGRIFFTDIEEGFEGKVVVGAPFSAQAITETTQSLADGNQIHHQTTASLYRDSQGRTRREDTLGALGPWSEIETHPQQVVGINDPVAGVHYILQPADHVAFKIAPRKGSLGHMTVNTGASSVPPPGQGPDVVFMAGSEALPPPPGGPEGGKSFFFIQKQGLRAEGKDQEGTTESLGTQTLEGVQVSGTRTTLTIPAGQIGNDQPINVVTERWYSPALQMVVTSKRSDPRIGVTTYRLTNINLDDPSPDLFRVPADYTVKDGPATFKLTKPAANQ